MAFGSGKTEQVKKFVSETELEEKRKLRQMEWEKVRKPDQPLGKWRTSVISSI